MLIRIKVLHEQFSSITIPSEDFIVECSADNEAMVYHPITGERMLVSSSYTDLTSTLAAKGVLKDLV
jgi:hypothetical protein